MEIIYRVYEKIVEGQSGFYNNNKILAQEVLQCESRNHFKEIMKDMYGKDIKFCNSPKLEIGKLFIVIISEHCDNAEKYLQVFKFECDNCGEKKLATTGTPICYIREKLIERESPKYYSKHIYDILRKKFCCPECREKYENNHIEKAIKYREEMEDVEDVWISKDRFDDYSKEGYIYMISKKSTGEFYVGQTKNNPIFRWGQHLLTNRFNMNNIEDYVFEILEKVPTEKLNVKETYWINKKRNENPKLSLNILIPKEDDKITLFDLEE